MKRLIIFDLDGTVGDTVASLAHTVNLCLRRMGLPEQPEQSFCSFAGDGARQMLKRALKAGGAYSEEILDELMKMYSLEFQEGCTYGVKSYPGLPRTLDSLKAYGVMLAVCTNKAQPYAESVLNKIYGEGYFDYILGEQPGLPRKPSPEGVFRILETLGVDADECVYVGDTNTDMQTGHNAGIFTVGVTWGFRPRKELEECKADRIIERPEELLKLEL